MHSVFHKFHPKIFRNNMRDLNILHSIQTFALGIISIFIPIFLYEKGFSIILIAGYLIMHPLLAILASYFSFHIISKFGLKKTFITSVFARLLFVCGLHIIATISSFEKNAWLLIIGISTIQAISDSLYWMSYHVEFTRFSKKKKTSKQVSNIFAFASTANILAPLIGGISILTLSYQTTFIIVAGLLFIGVLPMIFAKDKYEPFTFKPKDMFLKKTENYSLGYLSYGLFDIGYNKVWPILFFITVASTAKIGGLYTFTNLLNVASIYLVGHILTQHNRQLIGWIGTTIFGASGILRSVVSGFNPIILAQSIGGISQPLMSIPHHQKFYDHARKENNSEHIFFREFYLNLGRSIHATILLFLAILLPIKTALIIMIIFSAIALQGTNIMLKKK